MTISIYTDESLKLIEMRLLTMLATAVLLAGCVHDTDDFKLFVAESGVSLTYYIGSGEEGTQKDHDDPWHTIKTDFSAESTHAGSGAKNVEPDDPWDTIGEKYGVESVHTGTGKKSGEPDDPWDTITEKFGQETIHTGKSGEEDPWDRIMESFSLESVYTGKSGEEDPWNRINDLFPEESVHSGKTNDRFYFGVEKSAAVFVSFSYQMPTTFRARVVEVRGGVLKLEFTDGVEQYVIDAPDSWTEGTQLETGFLDAMTKKDQPFLGVRFWRTVAGNDWRTPARNVVSEQPVAWPSEYHASGASLLVSHPVGQKSEDDPWDAIQKNYALGVRSPGFGKGYDDPWDTIRENFSEDSVHTGSKKSHDDPWDRIGERKASFGGRVISNILFVSLLKDDEKTDAPWDVIQEKFPIESRSSTVLLKLTEVRGEVGRFCFVTASGGDLVDGCSIFAIGIPAEWETGLLLQGEAYLLDTGKMLPLMGAVSWETSPILR